MNKNRLFLACAFIAFGAVFSSNVFGTLEQPSKPEQQIVSNERVEEDSTTKIASDLQENNKKLKEALKEAAKILIHHFMLFSDEKIHLLMGTCNSLRSPHIHNVIHVIFYGKGPVSPL